MSWKLVEQPVGVEVEFTNEEVVCIGQLLFYSSLPLHRELGEKFLKASAAAKQNILQPLTMESEGGQSKIPKAD